MIPHKHAEIIKAWADGATIQYKSTVSDTWTDIPYNPQWRRDREYRVKPAAPARILLYRVKTNFGYTWHSVYSEENASHPWYKDKEVSWFTYEGKYLP